MSRLLRQGSWEGDGPEGGLDSHSVEETRESSSPGEDTSRGHSSGQGWSLSSGTGKAVEVLSLAILAPVAVWLGLKIGAWLGGFAGLASVGAVLGGALGGVGAFVELLRRARGSADG